MKLWKLDCDVEKYESLAWGETEYDIDLDLIHSFDGRPKAEGWTPLLLLRMSGNLPFGNSAGLSAHIPVLDPKAAEDLGDLVRGNGELLPVFCGGRKFFLLNVTRVLDCIDYGGSCYKTFRSGDRIMRFERYAFLRSRLGNSPIFKLKDEPLKRPVVTDAFRNRVLEKGLTGFIFEEIWDSEA